MHLKHWTYTCDDLTVKIFDVNETKEMVGIAYVNLENEVTSYSIPILKLNNWLVIKQIDVNNREGQESIISTKYNSLFKLTDHSFDVLLEMVENLFILIKEDLKLKKS